MPSKIKAVVWTDWVKVSAKQRVYTLPLHRYEAVGLMWESDHSVTLQQFLMIARQGLLKIITDSGEVFLSIPLSCVPGVSAWQGETKDILRLSPKDKLKIGEGWRAEVEFFDGTTSVPDPDSPNRWAKGPAWPWVEFPAEVKFRLVVV